MKNSWPFWTSDVWVPAKQTDKSHISFADVMIFMPLPSLQVLRRRQVHAMWACGRQRTIWESVLLLGTKDCIQSIKIGS